MPPRYKRRNVRRPRRKMYRRRRLARSRPTVHYFKRMVKISDVTASFNSTTGVSTNISGTYVFGLDAVPNSTEFTSLYDQYKIRGVKLSIVPSGNTYMTSTVSGATGQYGFGRINSVLDYDDSAPPVSENELLQYMTLKQTPGWKTHTRFIKPKVQFSVANDDAGGTVASAAPRGNCWLDCGNPSVDHLGIKLWIPAPVNNPATGNTSTSITYSVYATYYLAFKNVR